ncbi:hormonally up-regulated neu tumor-associated kinase homolog A isoform X1 [Salmo salar]|uniref:non-specific serine/threonine protein kinase n=1 Tax=Salmo salar TaxID=8030 RepID=A0A1S3RBF5_SALSA|nr:hormonally up-regulated neu tumor-associated kinase homolog A isoform X1 [Salmo salar]|eukprot:XP_014049680.1 PREDICTED: hormonally up-regulated neu tumor-associated kinase homolog A-like [Salmo salar]
MPAADFDMVVDSPRLHGGKAPASTPNNENVVPASLSSPAVDILRNFYHTKRVGNYLIGRKLGEGSFAKVREGLHAMTGEKVAVKVIDKRKAKKDSYVTKNLRREGHIQQMIRHPNITQLLDILETENSYYLVMELCPGGNLMNRIYDKKKLDERETQKYVRQLVMAVEHLHRAGVVHRDLKIENLLLDEQDNIKLIDFGLSNCAGILGYSDPFSTQCGSPAYAAPELLSRKKYGPKVDVWSIGVNMYAMLTGTLPFTVEPFSLRALHQKMVDKDMNPLPPSLSTAAICLLKKLLEPDPAKRPNIHQVMVDSWLQLANANTGAPYLNRIHIEEINHMVLLHMTERMGYKHSEVLSAVLTNRACHTLAVYFLLNNKMKRLSKEYREKVYQEKEKKTEKNEYFQTQWRKHVEKVTIPPKQTPVYLAVSKGPSKEKKHRNGLLRAVTGNFHRASPLAPSGTVASSSMEYLEIHPLFPRTPQPIRRLETLQAANTSPDHIPAPPAPSPIGMHSYDSLSKAEPIDDVVVPASATPWYKLTNGTFSPPRHVSAFHPDSSYLKKATIPSPPVLIVNPQPKKSSSNSGDWCGSDTSCSPPSTFGSPPGGSAFSPPKSAFSPLNPSSAFSPPSAGGSVEPDSPYHRGSKFPSMGIGQILKKKVPFQPFSFRAEQAVEEDLVSPPPYHMQTLLCASGALKTLC